MDDGGPAFPITLRDGESWADGVACDGMSLRDYFAAAAMQGVLADSEFMAHSVSGTSGEYEWRANCAASFYAWSDAMLAAREAKAVRP